MRASTDHFFDGLTEEELERIHQELELRSYAKGALILAEGDAPHEMYVIQSGTADIFISDQNGTQHLVSSVNPGETLGEMSIFTGHPVSATVRAATDLDVLVLSQIDFYRTMAAFPRLNYNLGAILSARLAQTNRQVLREKRGRIVQLHNHDAPPLLSYALAASVAWHTRRPTVLIVISVAPASDRLTSLAEKHPGPELPITSGFQSTGRPRGAAALPAELILTEPVDRFAPDAIERTLRQLSEHYEHVLVDIPAAMRYPEPDSPIVHLVGHNVEPPDPDESWEYYLSAWSDGMKRIRPDLDRKIQIPALSSADLDSLERGILPMGTSSGTTIGWVAREISNLQVGLALGAGGFKGYAHIGVLKVLERIGVPIDYISGASIGAAVGATYAFGFNPDSCARVLDRVGAGAFRPAIPTSSLLSSRNLRDSIKRISRNRSLEDLRIPTALVAADLTTGKEVVFRSGLLWPAILASMAIPGIYPPQRIGRYTLVDGGVLNPVPGDAVSAMGADVVIAVKLARRTVEEPIIAESVEASGRTPSVLQTVGRTLDIMQGKIVAETAQAATIQIEPLFTGQEGWGLRSFSDGRRFIDLGEANAEDAIPRMTGVLPWLRG